MTTIKVIDDGFLLDNKLLFGANELSSSYINLGKTLGDDMHYKKTEYNLVDYPGEFDIKDINIQVFLGKNNLLNYLIVYENKRIALIQSPDILESTADFAVALEWMYTNDSVLAKLEQLEVEGKIIKLGQVIENQENTETAIENTENETAASNENENENII